MINSKLNKFFSGLYSLIDFFLPDLDIFVGLRSHFFKIIYHTGEKPWIRKGNRIINSCNFSAGSFFVLSRDNILDNGSITFGDNCMVGFRNLFLTINHVEKDKQRKKEVLYCKPICIGNGVWITSNCTILPGTVIEDNVILSAGSVASGVLESGWIYRGNPAQKIRRTKGVIR
jgi:acetyltransferase-like isoleucine patch superfamily enzyme